MSASISISKPKTKTKHLSLSAFMDRVFRDYSSWLLLLTVPVAFIMYELFKTNKMPNPE